MRWVVPLAAAALFAAAPVQAEPQSTALISGIAGVVDGDTIAIGPVKIRLSGIDAPEAAQTCHRQDGRQWPCGRRAKHYLHRLILRKRVDCTIFTVDRHRRPVGVCWAGGLEIGREMVSAGYAVAYPAYVDFEAAAEASRRGIWSGPHELPRHYRQRRRLERQVNGLN